MTLIYLDKKNTTEDQESQNRDKFSGIVKRSDQLGKDWLSKGIVKEPKTKEKDCTTKTEDKDS